MLHTEVLGMNKEERKLEFVQVLLLNNSSFRIHTTHESSASKIKVFTTQQKQVMLNRSMRADQTQSVI